MARAPSTSTTQRLVAPGLAAGVTLLALGALAVAGLARVTLDAPLAYATLKGATVAVAGLFGALAIRGYMKDGTVHAAVLGGALLAHAAVLAPEPVFATLHGPGPFFAYGAAAVLVLALGLLALPVRAVTRDRLARRRIAAFAGGATILLTVLAVGLGDVVLDARGPAPVVTTLMPDALAALAVPVLVAVLALSARAAQNGAPPAPGLSPGVAFLTVHAAGVAFAAPWTLAWWTFTLAGAAGVLALAWAAFGAALNCERTEFALTAADARQERLAALGTLVAGVAHEINNPLMYVRGNIEIAMMDLEAAAMAQAAGGSAPDLDLAETAAQLRTSLEGTTRIARITESLRAVVPREDAEREPVDLAEAVRHAAPLAGLGAPPGVVVTVHAPAAPVVIEGRAADLHQVVLNLVRNAVEAMHDAPGEVLVRVAHRERLAEIVVTDTGHGIPPDVRRRLFTPFFSTKTTGTGLGLAIVDAIVKDHDGEVLVESDGHSGSTFTVRFPIREPTAVERRLEDLL